MFAFGDFLSVGFSFLICALFMEWVQEKIHESQSWVWMCSWNDFYLWMIHVFLWMIHGREYPEFECFHGRFEVGDGIANPPTLQLLLRSRSLRLSNSHPDKSFSWLFNIGGLMVESQKLNSLIKDHVFLFSINSISTFIFPLFDLRFVQETKLYWPL